MVTLPSCHSMAALTTPIAASANAWGTVASSWRAQPVSELASIEVTSVARQRLAPSVAKGTSHAVLATMDVRPYMAGKNTPIQGAPSTESAPIPEQRLIAASARIDAVPARRSVRLGRNVLATKSPIHTVMIESETVNAKSTLAPLIGCAPGTVDMAVE